MRGKLAGSPGGEGTGHAADLPPAALGGWRFADTSARLLFVTLNEAIRAVAVAFRVLRKVGEVTRFVVGDTFPVRDGYRGSFGAGEGRRDAGHVLAHCLLSVPRVH